MYAEIGFQRKVGKLTYEVPASAEPGSLVKVPLRSQKAHGIILSTTTKKPPVRTREIEEICAVNLLRKWQIKLLLWLSEYYFCPLNKVIKLFAPKKIFENRKLKEKKTAWKKPRRQTPKTLTPEQKEAFEKILKSENRLFLLHGITGSGKTEIYARLAAQYTKNSRQVLILVPEISLTPQTIEYFEKALGERASVIHSGLSEGERIRAWKDIKGGRSHIIIGSRSAIFSPFQNLGLLVVDEEHEPSYKQEQAPRYDARTTALKMAELIPELKVVFGSATPSCETFLNKKFIQLKLTERIDKTPLPEVEIADMREELKYGNYSIFSEKLHKEIGRALAKKEQIILFLNRRGTATAVICRDCGYKVRCVDCDVCMTYHKIKNQLICHHCGKKEAPPVKCPQCNGHRIKYLGIGTQKIEEETRKAFPEARILRADRDTVSKKHSFEKIYRDFSGHKADILIGTQMIGKGLHLPRVSLVGVVLADISLGIPDFRSSERTFQLLTQVAGRAGRGKKQGGVTIQTYEPDHPALIHAKTHNYNEFIKIEERDRAQMSYPPFSGLIKLTFTDKSEQKCIEETERLYKELYGKNDETCEIKSYPALITKKHGKYHYNILIKGAEPGKLLARTGIPENWRVDVDPISVN